MTNLSRIVKDTLIENYFKFRIYGNDNPYEILGRKQPYKILFILSHMRSGSSLLTHILNSNPEIIGYGETHTDYHSEQNFKDLMTKVYWKIRNYNMNDIYIMDKVLHNHKFINYDFLKSNQVYTIFLLREPQRTLASICDLKSHWSQEKAVNYYCDRLKMLEEYARYINNQEHSLLLTYEQLLNNTSSVFTQLQTFLDTKTPFTENYQILATTGVKGVGDSSDNIKAGSIIRESRKLATEINPNLTEQGLQSFQDCLANMLLYCHHINSM